MHLSGFTRNPNSGVLKKEKNKKSTRARAWLISLTILQKANKMFLLSAFARSTILSTIFLKRWKAYDSSGSGNTLNEHHLVFWHRIVGYQVASSKRAMPEKRLNHQTENEFESNIKIQLPNAHVSATRNPFGWQVHERRYLSPHQLPRYSTPSSRESSRYDRYS